jgi:hypothetical protein
LENKLSLLTIIVNSGFSDDIMNIVKEHGAAGGTILDGVGSVKKDAEKLYGITVNPEKEVVLIVVNKKMKNDLLKAIYHFSNENVSVKAIAFSLPIEAATSNLLSQYNKQPEE